MKNIKLKLICLSTVISCLTLSATPIIARADTITPSTHKSATAISNYQQLNQITYKTNSDLQKSPKTQSTIKHESSSFINHMSPYVVVKNGQYAISSDIYKNKNISIKDINKLENVLATSNQVVKNFNIKNLNVTQGNQASIKNSTPSASIFTNFVQINGYNGFRSYWWGCVISLNSENSTALIDAAVSGDAGGIGAAIGFCIGDLPGALAGGVICGILSGAMSVYANNSSEAIHGCNIQINYLPAPHVQAVWAE